VPTNLRNASYYAQFLDSDLPPKNPYPYGHVAQNLHRGNVENLRDTGTWDVLKNPKPASFSANLQGNLVPGTMDTHAFRNIAMRTGDPRFLETSLSEQMKPGVTPSPDSMIARYGDVRESPKGPKVVYRPQQLLKEGRLTMDEAQNIPYFWANQPNPNEYGAAEDLYRGIGAARGLPTADTQAAAWAGAGELTGLGTVPDKTFSELLNERIMYTAKMRGHSPRQVLSDLIRGRKPLLGLAGAGAATQATQDGDSQ
jgi:hypothetical protein